MGNPEVLGAALRQAREAAHLTKMDVDRRSGVSHSYLRRIEAGLVVAPSPHVLRRLAGALGTSYVGLCRAAGYLTPDDEKEIVTP